MANRIVGETEIIEVWPGAYGYENLTTTAGGFPTEKPSSAPITELFYSKHHKPIEYYTSRFFTDTEVENIENIRGVAVVKGLMYESMWSPDTPKWVAHETWMAQNRWNRSLNSEEPRDISFIESMEASGETMNITGLEYYLSIQEGRFGFNILGIETDKLKGVDSWFNNVKDGRFLDPGENGAIVISSLVSEELGLSIGDVINVPIGGIKEFDETAGTTVDTRTLYTFTVVGLIDGGIEEDAVVDYDFLLEALRKDAGEMSSVLPLYNRLVVKANSQDKVDMIKDLIKTDYPDSAILIRGKMSLQGFFR